MSESKIPLNVALARAVDDLPVAAFSHPALAFMNGVMLAFILARDHPEYLVALFNEAGNVGGGGAPADMTAFLDRHVAANPVRVMS